VNEPGALGAAAAPASLRQTASAPQVQDDEITRLQGLYDQLRNRDVSSLDEEGQLQHMMNLSQAMDDLQLAQVASAERRSLQVTETAAAVTAHESYQQAMADAASAMSNMQQLAAEYAQLEAADVTSMDREEAEHHFIRISQVMSDLEAAQIEATNMAAVPTLPDPRSAQPAVSAAAVESAAEDLCRGSEAESRQGDVAAAASERSDWPLPLGLQYPTRRMRRREMQVEAARQQGRRNAEAQHLERLMVERRRQREQQQRQEEEERQRQQQEQERLANLEQEEQRAAMRRAQAEADRQRRQREAEAQREEQEFQQLVRGRVQGLQMTGGGAKMCRRCGYGPIINQACNDMAAHNNDDGRRNQNHCPRCNWFDAEWGNWPAWDGGVRARNWRG